MSYLLIHGWETVLQIVLFDGEDHLRPCDIQHTTSSSNKWGISSCCQIILADQTSLGLGAVWELLQWEGCCSWRGSCCQTWKSRNSGRIIGPWSSGMMVCWRNRRGIFKIFILAFITSRVWRKKKICFPPTKKWHPGSREFVSTARKCSCNPAEQCAWHGKKCRKCDFWGTASHCQHRVVVVKSSQADVSLYILAFLFYN